MKVLIATEQFFPLKSGVSTVVTAIATELSARGHEVFVATSDLGRKEKSYKNVNIIEFRIYGGFSKFYRGEIQRYRDFVQEFQYDILINECVQNWSTDLILDLLPKIKAKKILHSHGFSLLAYRTKNPMAYIKAKIYYNKLPQYLKNYDHIFLLHDKTVETPYLQKHGIENYSYLPNGVDREFIHEVDGEKEKKYLLNISNYYPQKNQEFLLEAYYRSDAQCQLVFIGSAILKNYLKRLQNLKSVFDKKYGKKNVEFLLNISRKETLQYLQDATLFLHSSKLEVFPMVIVESMAKGVPYISTDVGNVSELAGGCVTNTIDEMAKEINLLLNDKIRYNMMAKEGLALVKETLTWNKSVDILEKVMHAK